MWVRVSNRTAARGKKINSLWSLHVGGFMSTWNVKDEISRHGKGKKTWLFLSVPVLARCHERDSFRPLGAARLFELQTSCGTSWETRVTS
jgi:hypothetical protein